MGIMVVSPGLACMQNKDTIRLRAPESRRGCRETGWGKVRGIPLFTATLELHMEGAEGLNSEEGCLVWSLCQQKCALMC